MCGICGEIRFDKNAASSVTVEKMTHAMARRGPNGSGVVHFDNVAFGHRRLKIIDLSEHSRQPMVDSALGLTIVYNGAIYNYVELREELRAKGHLFFSKGDTEVILKAYAEWGESCVERFNGMFAFAIHERDSNRVFMARDRLGIKPFYYADSGDVFHFASTLPALLHVDGLDTSIDPVALNCYMSFHAVVPAPHTIVNGIRKLPPASTLTIEPGGKRQIRTWWQPHFGPRAGEAGRSEEEWQECVLGELRRAVERRLTADVPVGVLLSGGLDSSLIVGLLAECGHNHIETFSIGFDSVDEEAGDEFKYSDIIAREFETRHHQIRIDAAPTLTALPDAVAASSEPMVSHDLIGFYLLSQEVARHVKVVESGQGADEVFAGYHWYPPMLESSSPVSDYASVFFDRDFAEYSQVVEAGLATEDFAMDFVRDHFALPGATRAIDKTLRLDTGIMLVDDPVKRVDNMTMAWGLEARVPFLDHELVELAARVPAELKVKGSGKHVLKEAARQVIPAAVIDRPKGYFPVPALKYLRGDYLGFVRTILEDPAARQRGIFRQDYVSTLLKDPESHITPLRGSKLWQIALLELWLQTHAL